MNKKLVVLAALVALAGFAAAASLTVKQRQDTASLYAERYTVGEMFTLEPSALAPVAASLPATGAQASPVEMASGFPSARTSLVQDHWMYSVVVKEPTSGAVGSGVFGIELQLDGASIGTVYATQGLAEAGAVEGVRASFDLGSTVGSSALYYIVVKPYVPTGPTIAATVRSNPNGNLTWLGVGGSIDSVVNPTISLALGSTFQLTAKNADGGTHNLGFKDAAGTLVNPPGWSANIDTTGAETTIAWTPPSAGSYTYRCQFHTGMVGTITVA